MNPPPFQSIGSSALPLRYSPLGAGGRLGSKNGVVYRGQSDGSVRREIPKVRGKAARRADKLTRRRERSLVEA